MFTAHELAIAAETAPDVNSRSPSAAASAGPRLTARPDRDAASGCA